MADRDLDEQDRLTIAGSVAESAFPGWRAVKAVPLAGGDDHDVLSGIRDAGSRPRADAVMPSIEELRAKYLSAQDGANLPPVPDAVSRQAADQDTLLVQMESGPLRRVVAVSAKEKKPLWSQG